MEDWRWKLDGETSKAERDVLDERRRQVAVEGFDRKHDDAHPTGVMAWAAACYAIGAFGVAPLRQCWKWDFKWWKPSCGRRQMLVKAGALIIAEIERGDRNGWPE